MSTSHRRSQAGLTMVELIVGLAVTSILLVGITGVLFSAGNAYTRWIDRIETSGTGDVLATALAADSHRYVTCSTSTAQLDFCLPGSDPPVPVVSYRDPGPAPYTVMRTVSPTTSRVVVRDLGAAIVFHVTCTEGGSVDVGFISVLGLPGRSELRVYFQTVRGECVSI